MTFTPKSIRTMILTFALTAFGLSGAASAGSLIGEFPSFMWPTDQSTCGTCAATTVQSGQDGE
jgi:hypothetical protein